MRQNDSAVHLPLSISLATSRNGEIELVVPKVTSSIYDLYYHLLPVDGSRGESESIKTISHHNDNYYKGDKLVTRAAPSRLIRSCQVYAGVSIRKVIAHSPWAQVRASIGRSYNLVSIAAKT